MTRRLIFILVLSIVLSGCTLWTPIQEPQFSHQKYQYDVQFPVGWVRFNQASGSQRITRDGFNLNIIEIERVKPEKAFPRTEAEASKDMLVQDLADNFVAEFKVASALDTVEVLENDPTTIDGFNGFRLHFQWETPKGLRYQTLVYGFANDNGFYTLVYRAPLLHYFYRDVATFEEVVVSFHVFSAAERGG